MSDIIATIEEVQINTPVVEEQIDVTLQGAIIEEFENPLIVNAGQNITVTDTGFSEIEVATVDDPDFTGINLDTVNPITISTAGQLAWNEVDGTVDIGLKNNVKLKTGQQLYFYGKAQGTIAKRDVVQFAGFQGDHILIKKAVGAEIEAFPEGLIGVAKQSLTNGQFGYVTWFGEVDGVSTTGWAVGDILYFDNVTGGLTNVAPLAPNRRIVIAAVEKLATGMAQNGVLLVRPTFGLKLKELDDVNGTALATTGQIPSYNASTGYFDFTENINNKQNTLISGTNIKTIEGQSLLGSGNIDITKSDVGLSNVDNTSDLNKPISTATQTALDTKVDKIAGKGLSTEDYTTTEKNKLAGIETGAQVNTVNSVAGKTGTVVLTKIDVGLGNVDNTSDLNKPISTATQTALDGKVDKVVGKGLSTEDYTTAEKNKLAGIEAGAEVNVNADWNAVSGDAQILNKPTISGTNTGDQNLFSTVAVAGQSNVVADSTSDTLTLVAGSNVTITTDASTDTITIASSGGGGGLAETFETVSKNLKSWDGTFNYVEGALSSIVYTDGVDTITKTFNYTTGVLTSIVLSGDTPAGIDLTKTLGYTSGDLTSITYS